MKFNLPVAAGIVVAIIAIGAAGLVPMPGMGPQTIFMMVVPSMVVFAAVVFVIGVKHGEYRATAR